MKGLLLKDIFSLSQIAKTQLFILVLFAFIFIPQSSGSLSFPVMCITVLGSMYFSTVNFDEQAKWNTYAMTMPIKRKDIVTSKYILAAALAAAGVILSIAIIFIASFFREGILISNSAIAALVGFFVSLFSTSIMMPVVFKFGVAKAQLLMVLSLLIPFGLIAGFGMLIQKLNFSLTENNIIIAGIGIAVLVVILFFCSIRLSIRFFEKKEL